MLLFKFMQGMSAPKISAPDESVNESSNLNLQYELHMNDRYRPVEKRWSNQIL